jgi:hypothetical protein
MNQKKYTILAISLVILMAAASSSCKRDTLGVPDPTGPSTLATIIKLGASPNVIAAGLEARQQAVITAHLYKFDGQAQGGKTIHFEVRDAFGMKANVGNLDNSMTVVSKVTDGSGKASVTYTGPIASELDVFDNFTLYVYAWVGWQGKEEISELCPIHIVGDVLADLEIEFELQAFPNVLWCAVTPPISKIRGVYTYGNGVPVVGRKVFFEITGFNGPPGAEGEFADGLRKTFAVTDANGVAEILYIGPTGNMLTGDAAVWIQGQPETDWIHIQLPPDYDPDGTDPAEKYYIHKTMGLRLIKAPGTN